MRKEGREGRPRRFGWLALRCQTGRGELAVIFSLCLVDPLVPKVAAAVDFISKLPGIVLLPPKIVLTEMQEMEPRPYRNVASLHFLMVIISC